MSCTKKPYDISIRFEIGRTAAPGKTGGFLFLELLRITSVRVSFVVSVSLYFFHHRVDCVHVESRIEIRFRGSEFMVA